ncbi:MAG: hypothetical protein R3B90_06110 [Planctomycetaceae bacterium]
MWNKLLFVVASLLLPVLWGAAVTLVFRWWRRRDTDDAPPRGLSDFQI